MGKAEEFIPWEAEDTRKTSGGNLSHRLNTQPILDFDPDQDFPAIDERPPDTDFEIQGFKDTFNTACLEEWLSCVSCGAVPRPGEPCAACRHPLFHFYCSRCAVNVPKCDQPRTKTRDCGYPLYRLEIPHYRNLIQAQLTFQCWVPSCDFQGTVEALKRHAKHPGGHLKVRAPTASTVRISCPDSNCDFQVGGSVMDLLPHFKKAPHRIVVEELTDHIVNFHIPWNVHPPPDGTIQIPVIIKVSDLYFVLACAFRNNYVLYWIYLLADRKPLDEDVHVMCGFEEFETHETRLEEAPLRRVNDPPGNLMDSALSLQLDRLLDDYLFYDEKRRRNYVSFDLVISVVGED